MALVVAALAAAIVLFIVALYVRAYRGCCPRCRKRHAVYLAGSLWSPVLYCVRCRHEWTPPMTVAIKSHRAQRIR